MFDVDFGKYRLANYMLYGLASYIKCKTYNEMLS
jgi:hypothetical protein